jgi:hypothetical protein
MVPRTLSCAVERTKGWRERKARSGLGAWAEDMGETGGVVSGWWEGELCCQVRNGTCATIVGRDKRCQCADVRCHSTAISAVRMLNCVVRLGLLLTKQNPFFRFWSPIL